MISLLTSSSVLKCDSVRLVISKKSVYHPPAKSDFFQSLPPYFQPFQAIPLPFSVNIVKGLCHAILVSLQKNVFASMEFKCPKLWSSFIGNDYTTADYQLSSAVSDGKD